MTVISPAEVESKIQRLERLRAQNRLWRLGLTAAALGIMLVCVGTIASAVKGLTSPGPTQTVFADELTSGLQKDVVPSIQTKISQTVQELRPEIEQELAKANDRVPELTQATLEQLDLLQKNVPEKSQEVVRKTFGDMMEKREPKLKEMFPDVTEEKVSTLVENLSEEGQNRIILVHDKLFSGHQEALDSIVADMEKIRLAENPDVSTEKVSWEAGLIFLDLLRSEMKGFESTTPGNGNAPAVTKAAAAPTKEARK